MLVAMSELDAIVEKSLRSFFRNICSEWCGRENEMVSLYAFGHLVKHVRRGTILSELTCLPDAQGRNDHQRILSLYGAG